MPRKKTVEFIPKTRASGMAVSDEPDPVDLVNHPPHYTFGKYEVIDVLQDWFPTNPLLWQVCKYIARADHKENPVQDLEKAKFYLEREIERRKEGADK